MERNLKCSYCDTWFLTSEESVRHCISGHRDEKVSFRIFSSTGENIMYKCRTFKLFGKDVLCDPQLITYSDVTGKLNIPNVTSTESSPLRKMLKVNTPTKSVHRQLFSQDPLDEKNEYLVNDIDSASSYSNKNECLSEAMETTTFTDINEEKNEMLDDTYDKPVLNDSEVVEKAVSHMRRLLPSVTSHLAENGRLSEWMSFFNLVDNGMFHVNHIASQLFFDVIKFATADDARAMRYSPEVKEFWTVGQSLFRSKFIRFMGGYKTMAQNNEKIKSNVSMVNSACPDDTVLKEQKQKYNINCDKPGLIESNIDTIAKVCPSRTKSYNLCVDGKKITSGFGKNAGEVDLFGHESNPTLCDKRNRLEVEMLAIQSTTSKISAWIERDIESILNLPDDSKTNLSGHLLDIISLITERIQELRHMKVKRQITLDKLLKMADEPWQKSKYSLAISSIKTQMHTVNMLIDEALEINKKLGLAIAACHGAEDNYSLETVVHLQHQENYVCLRSGSQFENKSEIPSHLIKQRSEKWHQERKKAKVTGSTIYRALGLSTLKEQREHFDKKEKSYSEQTESPMQHGLNNEINAIGTLTSSVLPVFVPFSIFNEEGFYKLPSGADPNFYIVSPDGSCRHGDRIDIAVEIKCPVPGKKSTLDVHYKMPKYYVGQCLAEMAAMNCNSLLYLSWTPESTTVMKAEFDKDMWSLMTNELEDISSIASKAKLSKKRPIVGQLVDAVDKYVTEKVSLICEFPSNVSIPCHHESEMNVQSLENLKSNHTRNNKHGDINTVDKVRDTKLKHVTTQSMQKIMTKAEQLVNEIYKVLRIPAKEVLVAVLSDLDRTNGPCSIHGVPIAYGLSGYSLKVESMRSMINEIVKCCSEKGIEIKSLSTDGQFYSMCVRNAMGEPLTVLQVAKDTWERARKTQKAEQVQQLMRLNYETHETDASIRKSLDTNLPIDINDNEVVQLNGPIFVKSWRLQQWPKLFNPPKLSKLIQSKDKNKQHDTNVSDELDFDTIPLDAINALCIKENADYQVEISNHLDMSSSGSPMTKIENTEDDEREPEIFLTDTNVEVFDENENILDQEFQNLRVETCSTKMDIKSVSCDIISRIINDLKLLDVERKKPKWGKLDNTKLSKLLSSEPSVLLRAFTKNELMKCALPFQVMIGRASGKNFDQMTKTEFVNAFSKVFGTEAVVSTKKSPKKLRQILKDFFSQKLNKETLNAITATRMFLDHDLPNWREKAPFRDGIYIGNDVKRYVWYSQPEYVPVINDYIPFLLDCHHLFVNARSYVCQHDISGLNVKKNAWVAVSQSPDNIEIGLNQAMVNDLIDRQSNAIAQIVFSEKVEKKMVQLGWYSEANFCKRIREWYMAEDEPGLTVDRRHELRMNIRTLFLSSINLAEFPPPGMHVSGMPAVMFEGILTNIDRRIQLYATVPGHAYNVRAPNTLAVENLFSGFQDLDPKSSGVLLADDIPHALETASYLIQMRLNPERPFAMRTSRASRVYPANVLHQDHEINEYSPVTSFSTSTDQIKNIVRVPMTDHSFDKVERRKKHPKRKKGSVPDYDKPSRGTMPVRQYHKADSSKILPHVRHGLKYDL